MWSADISPVSIVWVIVSVRRVGLCFCGLMVRLVRVAWFELNSLCVIAGLVVEGVEKAWALVSGLQRGDVALDGRSGEVTRF